MPVVAVSVCPDFTVPVMVGRTVLAGTAFGATTTVWAELAGADGPTAFDAVTASLSVEPASGEPTTYVDVVASGITEQLAPVESQRCHW